jgi:hypothetical protein
MVGKLLAWDYFSLARHPGRVGDRLRQAVGLNNHLAAALFSNSASTISATASQPFLSTRAKTLRQFRDCCVMLSRPQRLTCIRKRLLRQSWRPRATSLKQSRAIRYRPIRSCRWRKAGGIKGPQRDRLCIFGCYCNSAYSALTR